MYTNIRNIEAIKAAKHTLDRHRVDDAPVTVNDITRLLALVLRYNDITRLLALVLRYNDIIRLLALVLRYNDIIRLLALVLRYNDIIRLLALVLRYNDIIRLLALVLHCNSFEFKNSHYFQTKGVAMGTRAAPTVANLVMGEFEVKWVYTYDLQAILWVRFIDDIFLIWTHGVTLLKQFIHHLNSVYPTLKFTAVWSEHQITVLDVLIKLNQNGTLTTNLYVKPIDTHMYLHYSSCHPKTPKRIVVLTVNSLEYDVYAQIFLTLRYMPIPFSYITNPEAT